MKAGRSPAGKIKACEPAATALPALGFDVITGFG